MVVLEVRRGGGFLCVLCGGGGWIAKNDVWNNATLKAVRLFSALTFPYVRYERTNRLLRHLD